MLRICRVSLSIEMQFGGIFFLKFKEWEFNCSWHLAAFDVGVYRMSKPSGCGLYTFHCIYKETSINVSYVMRNWGILSAL
jgi:hypothetical protein